MSGFRNASGVDYFAVGQEFEEPAWSPKVGDEVLAAYEGNWKRATLRLIHGSVAVVTARKDVWLTPLVNLQPVEGSK